MNEILATSGNFFFFIIEKIFFNSFLNFLFSTYPFLDGVAQELRPSSSDMGLPDMENLSERMCDLRITATVNVMGQLGHTVPTSVTNQLTPLMVFKEEERILTSEGGDMSTACRNLMAVSRGAPSFPPDDSNVPDPLDTAMVPAPSSSAPTNSVAARNPGREPEGQYSDMETEG